MPSGTTDALRLDPIHAAMARGRNRALSSPRVIGVLPVILSLPRVPASQAYYGPPSARAASAQASNSLRRGR